MAKRAQLGRLERSETEIGLQAGGVSGLDVIELGCGTAYVSAWLAQRGARPVAVVSQMQLSIARRLKPSTASSFRSCSRTPKQFRFGMNRSTSQSLNTEPPLGASRVTGFPKRRVAPTTWAPDLPHGDPDPEHLYARRQKGETSTNRRVNSLRRSEILRRTRSLGSPRSSRRAASFVTVTGAPC